MPTAYPPLAGVTDVEDRAERTFSGPEVVRAEALLNSVSIKARRHTGRLWLVLGTDGVTPAVPYQLDPNLPETVWDIVVTAVERSMRNPDGFSSESAGDYSYQRVGIPGGVGGLYLTEDEVATLREFRPGENNSVGGLWTLGTTRNEYADDTIWFSTAPSGSQLMAVDSLSDFPE